MKSMSITTGIYYSIAASALFYIIRWADKLDWVTALVMGVVICVALVCASINRIADQVAYAAKRRGKVR